jgi:hypothetical protein
MDRDLFIQKGSWYGSFYELAIELQTSHDDIRLGKALETLWRHPNLSGHWLSIENFGQKPDVISIPNELQVESSNSFINLYGLFSIPDIDKQVGCLSTIVRESNGSDWLDFCFPIGMLKSAFSVNHQLEMREYPWSATLDRYLLQMADMIYQKTPFDLALIGEEVSGLVNKASIISEGIESQIKIYDLSNNKIFLSPEFWNEISVDKNYEVTPSGLQWATLA